jgi:hypothetical protein
MSDHLVAIGPADHHKTDEGIGKDVRNQALNAMILGVESSRNCKRL